MLFHLSIQNRGQLSETEKMLGLVCTEAREQKNLPRNIILDLQKISSIQ